MFKNFVSNSGKTHRVSITETEQLILFREIIAVYSGYHMKQRGQNTHFFNIKAGGIYCNHSGLKDQPTNQPTNQPTSQSINQPTNQVIN
jgi:hypothetical protein